MIVVDSSVWIDTLRKLDNEGTPKLKLIKPSGQIVAGDLVDYEVWRGARDDLHADQLEKYFSTLDTRQMLNARAECPDRNCGGGHQLLHNDRDFVPVVKRLGLQEY